MDEIVLKGEVVLLIDNQNSEAQETNELTVKELITAFKGELPASKLAKVIAKLTNENRQDIYQQIEDTK